MSHYSTLEGYIEILASEMSNFKETKLFKHWIDNKQAEFSHDNVDYLNEGDNIKITFGDVYNRNYSREIKSDLTRLCQKVSFIDIDLLLWSSDGRLTAEKYYTNDQKELILQELDFAPMTKL